MVKNIPYDTRTRLKPGRHFCYCQARVHELVRNCLNCGRVVCKQEGSGPCFNCGNMVCTREEQKVLNAGDKQSYELLKTLDSFAVPTEEKGNINFDSISRSLLSSKEFASIESANQYKEKLLLADKNCNSTKVNDLESDYYNVEHNAFLSAEDRELLIKRKEELRQSALEAKRKIIFNLDITNKSVAEAKQSTIETINDPIIQAILTNAIRSKEATTSAEITTDFGGITEETDGPSTEFIRNFVPKCVNQNIAVDCTERSKKIMPKSDKVNLTWCISLPPSLASQLSNGIRSHIPWNEEVHVRSLVIVASLGKGQASELLNEKCDPNLLDCPSSCIIGRAVIVDCLTFEEYKLEYSQGECVSVENGFVLIFNLQEALTSPLVHSSSAEFYPVDRGLAELVRRNLICDVACNSEFTSLEYF